MVSGVTDWRDQPVGFIGAGRLATGLAMALHRNGIAVTAISSRSTEPVARFLQRVPQCRPADPQTLVAQCSLIFITVPDDAIATVANGLHWRPGVSVVHCSGATELAALAHAERQGAEIGGFHPVQAFTDPVAAAESLPGCTVSIEAREPLLGRLEALADAIGCRAIRLPPGCRALYHASNAYASQFVNVLLREASSIWQSFGLGEEDAVRALLPLLKGITASIETQGIAKGMPGPVSRGDAGTIRRHVEALATLDAGTSALYLELTRRTVTLALERGSIDADVAAELKVILGSAD